MPRPLCGRGAGARRGACARRQTRHVTACPRVISGPRFDYPFLPAMARIRAQARRSGRPTGAARARGRGTRTAANAESASRSSGPLHVWRAIALHGTEGRCSVYSVSLKHRIHACAIGPSSGTAAHEQVLRGSEPTGGALARHHSWRLVAYLRCTRTHAHTPGPHGVSSGVGQAACKKGAHHRSRPGAFRR